jgi:hypothetical protein
VTDNRAAVDAPNGFNTDAGGIASAGQLTVEDSAISGNTSAVAGAQPAVLFVDIMLANAGGFYLTSGSSTTIRRSQVNGNTVIGSNTAGDVQAEAGGIDSDGALLLSDSSVDHNTVTASVPADSGFTAEVDSGGLQIGGLQVDDTTIVRNSRVTHNTISATSMSGTALAAGGGLLNTRLTLEHSVVTANGAAATGVTGVSLGAGIANIHLDGPLPELTVTDSVVAANRLSASPGVAMLGSGLFNLDITNLDPFTTGQPLPVTLTGTVIHGNRPDQCAGC